MVSIDKARLRDLLEAVFADERPVVFGAYSEYDRELETFDSPGALETRISAGLGDGKRSFGFALWYPGTGGRVERERIDLKPEHCRGHTFRYSVGGWGVFQLQLDFKRDPIVECRIAVNSRKRAVKWEATYHAWLAVDSWQWSEVERRERRLTRKLRALAQAPADPK